MSVQSTSSSSFQNQSSLISSSPFGREVRKTTQDKTLQSKQKSSPNGKGRKVLSPSKTNSLARSDNHDCMKINKTNTIAKTHMRLDFSMFRFSLAYGWQCITTRGRTHYNGGQPHCEGNCQAAHAALSPTLYDNQLDLIINKIQTVSFSNLTSHEQKYLEKRFELPQEQKSALDNAKSTQRAAVVQKLTSQLKSGQQKGSFVLTKIDYARNATFDNPRGCNRVDCSLEYSLRALEDTLAEECRTAKKHPLDALVSLQSCYEETLYEMQVNLEGDKDLLEALLGSWEALLETQETLNPSDDPLDPSKMDQQAFTTYLKAVDQYLSIYEARFDKSKGAPQFEELRGFLDSHQSPYTLRTLSKLKEDKNTTLEKTVKFYCSNICHLRCPEDEEKYEFLFLEATDQVELRSEEVELQIEALNKTADVAHSRFITLFGQKDSQGNKLSASETADKLLELMDPISQCQPVKSKKRKNPDPSPTPNPSPNPPDSSAPPTKKPTKKKLDFNDVK